MPPPGCGRGLKDANEHHLLFCHHRGVNRPGFPRHFPGSVNVASQTLPVSAGVVDQAVPLIDGKLAG
jgi:hypothetical protein